MSTFPDLDFLRPYALTKVLMSTGQSFRDCDLIEVAEYIVEQKPQVEETKQLV